ncbi:DNA translocase FtsK [Sulfurovum sp. ST-21]|uniref:FtsK gamma domain-containing protein n=1 Tax=Sulfurovum indicum TaxID=2779528 RepID=A0A7M1S1I8_9BACT|nr:DNA translocase FtsK [Sulfurovum indicum]QOR61216.1 hypothetical protein IMZ28_07080 [Sulfurovum indicum]
MSQSGTIVLDKLYEQAKQIVLTDRKSTIVHLQRKLHIGYERAGIILQQLEATGVVTAPESFGKRRVMDDFQYENMEKGT